ncbi:MAG TPA: hypothetical protein VF515_14750 [Candidatus Binatia bacterium]
MIEAVRTTFGRWLLVVPAALAVLVLVLVRFSDSSDPAATLVVALVSGDTSDVRPSGEGDGNTLARLKSGAPPRIITAGFTAAVTPRVSYDGRRAIFAGRRAASDPMQIWEVSVMGSSPRLMAGGGECLDPAYLPDGGIVYARSLPGAGLDAPQALYTTQADGRGERRITFGEAHDRAPAVLPDGRVVFRRHPRVGDGPGRLFVINPDGTGLQLFYEPADGVSIDGGPWVIDDRVIFAETVPRGATLEHPGSRLVSVSARQPLGQRDILSGGGKLEDLGEERFASVSKLPEGGLVASAYVKRQGWSLRQLTPHGESAAQALAQALPPASTLSGLADGLRLASVALAMPQARPLGLTSVVDERKSTGTLLCLNVRNSRNTAVAEAKPATIRTVRVLAVDGQLLGEDSVEADGSFFVEVPADQPLRLELRGPEGVVAADHSGLWVRPNENRGCIGCHEDPEVAPENRVVQAVEKGQAPARATAQLARSEKH